jgi:CTP-dependent riboflavin kinase
MNLFPGSLNLELECSFDWYAKQYQPRIVWFGREEYGGERDILLLPCILPKLDATPAFLWTTTTAAQDRPNKNLIEVITDVPLRASYGLVDGDWVDVELTL